MLQVATFAVLLGLKHTRFVLFLCNFNPDLFLFRDIVPPHPLLSCACLGGGPKLAPPGDATDCCTGGVNGVNGVNGLNGLNDAKLLLGA